MLLSLLRRLRSAVSAIILGIARAASKALRPWPVVGGVLADVGRSRGELIAENVLLRQQLIVGARAVKRPAFRVHERGLLVLLARLVPRWRNACS